MPHLLIMKWPIPLEHKRPKKIFFQKKKTKGRKESVRQGTEGSGLLGPRRNGGRPGSYTATPRSPTQTNLAPPPRRTTTPFILVRCDQLLLLSPVLAAAVAMAITAQIPDIMGERQSGQDVRTQNGNTPPSSSSSYCFSRHEI